MAKENGVWRTVGGRRIFIGEGEDLATAMKKSGKFKNKKKDDDEDELKRKYLDISQEERAKAYEEGKNWKDLVKEKEQKSAEEKSAKEINKSEREKVVSREKEKGNYEEDKKKYLEISQEERIKAVMEGKDWRDLVREKEEKTKVNESNVRKLFDKEKEYKFNDNVKNEIEWKEKNKEILEKGYKEETGTDPYKNGKEKTSFEDYQTWRYGLEYKKVHKK